MGAQASFESVMNMWRSGQRASPPTQRRAYSKQFDSLCWLVLINPQRSDRMQVFIRVIFGFSSSAQDGC